MTARDSWKATLLTVSDSAFFEIMRNYLGDLKTPFNKHDLIARLDSFLRDETVQQRIVSLIDESEAKVLTAIAMMDGPTVAELHTFGLTGESYADLHYAVLNLEDRLIIYEDEQGRIWITPHLSEPLKSTVIHPGRLFPSIPVEESESTAPWLVDVLLLAVLSFLLEEPDLFRSDGELRKRGEGELAERFPAVFGDGAGNRRWAITTSILETCGLVKRSESKLLPQLSTWKEIAELPTEARLNLCWSAAIQGLGWGRDQAAERLAGFLAALPSGRALSTDAVRRIVSYASGNEGESSAEGILEVFVDLGLLLEPQEGWFCKNAYVEKIPTSGHENEPGIIVQPNFEVTVKPWISLEHGLPLALAAEILRYDTYPRFEITKTSVARALSSGEDAEAIRSSVSELSGGFLPQNIAFSLDDWAREYESVQLYEGTVLVVDEERRHFVEHSEEFQDYVHRSLAPGVFLVRSGFESALQAAGIDIVPPIQRVSSSGSRLYRLPKSLRKFRPERLTIQIDTQDPPKLEPGRIADDLKELIDSSSLDADLKDDLKQRLKRKLIVHRDQVRSARGLREKSEARGLDYLGKVKLIQQTISSRTHHLEVVARDKKGAPLRYLVHPSRLDKNGTELQLIGHTIPEGRDVQLPVSKLSLVRKLRGTFFGR